MTANQHMFPSQHKLIERVIEGSQNLRVGSIFSSITDFKDKNSVSINNSRVEGEVLDSIGFVRK